MFKYKNYIYKHLYINYNLIEFEKKKFIINIKPNLNVCWTNRSEVAFPEYLHFHCWYQINFFIIKKILRDGELNPGLPRDRRGYSPLYYLGSYKYELYKMIKLDFDSTIININIYKKKLLTVIRILSRIYLYIY